jgi:Ca2+-transporting ATPase
MGAGHARNASLTVPGGDAPPPSSPTLSTTSEMSAMGPDSPSPEYRTSLALRDNDPRTAHARQISIASAFTDASAEPASTANGGMAPSASSQVKFEQSSPTSDGRGEKLRDVPDAAKKESMKGVPADEADAAAKLSGWQRFKASVHGKTRAGRAKAIQDEIDAEKKRQYEMDPAPFKYRPVELGELVDPKSVALLRDMGGVKGLLAALGTDGTSGLDVGGTKAEEEGAQRESEKDIERAAGSGEPRGADWVQASHEQREKVYGRNVLPTKKSKSLLLLMWLALQDKILILLCIAAVVSLALGLYTDFGADPEFVPQIVNGELTEVRAPQIDWVEGVAILIAVVIVDVVGSVNDYQKELQFKKLNAKKEERDVKVIRQGRPALMSVHDVCVGDVLQLEPGEILPADGVFLRGHNVKCDESGATGESDMIRKITYDEALEQLEAAEANGTKPPNRDCFLISGARVLEGAGEYVVIAVGPSSFNGKLMLSLRTEAEMTPLQAKLNRLAEIIAYCGSAAGLLLFVALMIRFFVSFRPGQPSLTPDERGKQFIDILVIAVTVVVVAVPEGLPLATTLALAFATKRMTEQNLLVRVLGACETMANASVICTDKTGTLTQNEMSVVAGSVGVHLKFAYNLEENKGRIESPEDDSAAERMASRSSLQRHQGRRDWAIDQQELGSVISGKLRTLLSDSISVNSSAFEEVAEAGGDDKQAPPGLGALKKVSFLRRLLPKKKVEAEKTKQLGFVGSKTETALLKMAKELGWEDYRVSRERNEVVTSFPFSSERKAMGVVIRKPEGGYRFLVKGASEVLTKICTRHVIVPDPDSGDADGDVQTAAFTKESQENVAKTIIFYANQTLRTIGVCYRDFDTPSWPPQGATMTEEGELDYDFLARDLTLLAVVGIEDPLRPGVRDAVAACTQAGVQVKMCTGDNALTARSIATQCGIYTPGGIIMEGPVFRKLSDADMDAVVPRLQVLARSSPEDKKILVERLKRMGEIVGVTGDGTVSGCVICASVSCADSMRRTTDRLSRPPTWASRWALPARRSPRRRPTSSSWTTTSPRSSRPSCGAAASTTPCAASCSSSSRSTSVPCSSRSSVPSRPTRARACWAPCSCSGSTSSWTRSPRWRSPRTPPRPCC